MKIWLPEPIYKLKPWIIMIVSVMILLASSRNLFVILIGIALFGYSVYILAQRFMWRDTTHIDMFGEDTDIEQKKDES